MILVGGIIELNAIPARLGKGHWGQRRADLGAGGQRVVVLAFGVGGDDKPVEPGAEAAVLEY